MTDRDYGNSRSLEFTDTEYELRRTVLWRGPVRHIFTGWASLTSDAAQLVSASSEVPQARRCVWWVGRASMPAARVYIKGSPAALLDHHLQLPLPLQPRFLLIFLSSFFHNFILSFVFLQLSPYLQLHSHSRCVSPLVSLSILDHSFRRAPRWQSEHTAYWLSLHFNVVSARPPQSSMIHSSLCLVQLQSETSETCGQELQVHRRQLVPTAPNSFSPSICLR